MYETLSPSGPKARHVLNFFPTSLKDSYLQMLIHLEEDFDDVLLQDAMEILGCVNK